jgi:hypothetical protein
MTEATEVEVTQADEARALEIFNDALGDMSSFAEFGWPNYYDGALRTISVYLARHRQSSVPVQGEPVAWDDDEAFRQMHLLYNYSDDDSRQFTRWQMAVAMQHGQRHAPTERERVLLEALVDVREVLTMVAKPARLDPDKHFTSQVQGLGDAFGYGALMTCASALWRQRLGDLAGGEFAAGPCVATVQKLLKRVESAIAQAQEPE